MVIVLVEDQQYSGNTFEPPSPIVSNIIIDQSNCISINLISLIDQRNTVLLALFCYYEIITISF
jgi:hypothetical protein